MVTKRDNQPTDRGNIEQSASRRLEGRVLQYLLKAAEEYYLIEETKIARAV